MLLGGLVQVISWSYNVIKDPDLGEDLLVGSCLSEDMSVWFYHKGDTQIFYYR